MKKVVVCFYSIANPEPVIKRGLEVASNLNSVLDLYFILEKQVPGGLSDLLANIGFLGEKVKADMERTILENYHSQVQETITIARNKAEKLNVRLNTEIVEDDMALVNYRTDQADYVIINHTKDDYFFKSDSSKILQDIREQLNIDYEIYYDGIKESLGE